MVSFSANPACAMALSIYNTLTRDLVPFKPLTSGGGIIGSIHYVNDDGTLSVEIADNVNVKVAKGMVADIATK